jgi:hypothetical protein
MRFKCSLHSIVALIILGCVGVTCSSSPFADIGEGGNPQAEIPHCYRGMEACGACSDQFGCTECDEDIDCPRGVVERALCVFGYCSRCRTDADCDAGMVCSPRSRSCEAPCASNADCSGEDAACSASHSCVQCSSDTDCSAERPLCDKELGRCAKCVSAADCTGTTSICDRRRGVCAECMIDADCQSPGHDGICDATAVCRRSCAVDADCTDPGAPTCTNLGICMGPP